MTQYEKLHVEKTRAMICALYPGRFNFDRATVAKIIGCTEGHLRNRECEGKPVIRSVSLGRKRVTQLPDLIDFLIRQGKEEENKNRRGPRSKAERIESRGRVPGDPEKRCVGHQSRREKAARLKGINNELC